MILGGLFMHPSCTKDYLELTIEIPDSVSFSMNIIPILTDDCATKSGCHGPGGLVPVLTPGDAFENLWIYGYIDTTNATSSRLYTIVNSGAMPKGEKKLPQGEIDIILKWIEQGAQDN